MTTLHGQPIKVGDRVWGVQYGWGAVTEIATNSSYPIAVYGHGHNYTPEGKKYTMESYPTLFWQEVVIPTEAFIKPLPQLEVDTKVIVWGEGSKHKRHFSHFLGNGKICCFNDGATSWASKFINEWDNWELYEEETK